jgi:hypothetical protein
MGYHSFVRLADSEHIPIPAESVSIALAQLGQREQVSLSLEGEAAYIFARSDHHAFWCRPASNGVDLC